MNLNHLYALTLSACFLTSCIAGYNTDKTTSKTLITAESEQILSSSKETTTAGDTDSQGIICS